MVVSLMRLRRFLLPPVLALGVLFSVVPPSHDQPFIPPTPGTVGGSGIFFSCPITSGAANTYSCTTPNPTGFALNDQWAVQAKINTTNTAASTLNVGSTGDKPIKKQSITGGLVALGPADLVAPDLTYTFVYSLSADAFILSSTPSCVINPATGPITLTTAEFAAGCLISNPSGTLTMPNSASGALGAEGAYFFKTGSSGFSLKASGNDVIVSRCTTSAGGGTVTIPAGGFYALSADGATAPETFTISGGPSCSTALLDAADQGPVTGGANVTTLLLAAGNTTIDCGLRPQQRIPNTGAFTLTAPASDGNCILDIENGASAGTVTLSGFSPNSLAPGSATLTTTNGNNFRMYISRLNSHSSISAVALQ